MEDINEFTELEDRYCPICDKKVKKGSPFHKCSKRKLKELDKRHVEKDLEEEERTYDDKLKEFDEQYNNEHYYDLEE
jgi:hypothetical protein